MMHSDAQANLDDAQRATKQHVLGADERTDGVVVSLHHFLILKRLDVPHLRPHPHHQYHSK